MTPRDLVEATLEFRNTGGRVPRQLWTLPWAEKHHGALLQRIKNCFPDDIISPHTEYREYPKTRGNAYQIGEYVDEWGCVFENIQEGVIGEVKDPLVKQDDWSDAGNVHIPEELLSFNIQKVNAFCAKSDRFITCGACPRPFEQLQFIRTSALLYMDLTDVPVKMRDFIQKMHDYYCRLLTKWAQTDVDALNFMDDWGAQRSLLISPKLWREIFKPLYRDYIDIAHRHGKKIFMHSDGYTLNILPDLIDLGLDAINMQIFCIGVDNLKRFRGKITFWGEMDRQHLLPKGSIQDIDRAVKLVYDTLWSDGGCIAQCEFGAGARPENVYQLFDSWNTLR